MQAIGGFHHQVIKTFAKIAENVMGNAKDFDAANAVFDTSPLLGSFLVGLFLLSG